MAVKYTDNTEKVLRIFKSNIPAALAAIGTTGVRMTIRQMQRGYDKPIRDTGALQNDVQFEVQQESQTVDIGNTLKYAPFVHDGTYRMYGRPYLSDTFTNRENQTKLAEVAAEQLKKGLE